MLARLPVRDHGCVSQVTVIRDDDCVSQVTVRDDDCVSHVTVIREMMTVLAK